MSSSALASARRRRAGGESAAVPPITTRNAKVEQQEAPIQNQPLTPLVILQQHEQKIRQLEGLITKEEDYEELFQQIDEKIDKLFTVNFEVFNNELDTLKSRLDNGTFTSGSEPASVYTNTNTNAIQSLIEDKIDVQSSRIEDFKSSQSQLFSLLKDDTTKVLDLLTTNMETKITLINSNTSQLENKLNELSVDYENQQASTNVLTKLEYELNMVKTTLISNQSMILEMSNVLNNIKDTLKEHKEHITSLTSKIEALGTGQERRNSTHALLSSLMSMNTRCINPNNMSFCCEAEDCEAEECQSNSGPFNFNTENLGELNIDLNNDELIMDENQIAELLEIRNFDNINIDDTIEELECEIVEPDAESLVESDAPISAPLSVDSDAQIDAQLSVDSDAQISVVS
jgi:chromosome segregation ATPase